MPEAATRIPSIKGTALQSVVSDVCQLLEQGRVTREQAEVRLTVADLALLEEKILPAAWYPIESYQRLSELLMDVEGGGSPQYLVERGSRAAERLFESGIYLQLRRGETRAQELREAADSWSELDGNLIVSIAAAIFNFARWRFRLDADDERVYVIEVDECEALPEVGRHAAHGFMQYTASRLVGAPVRVESERPRPDRVVYVLRLSSRSRAGG